MRGVGLPPPGPMELCSPCNPGQQRVNGTCEFCPLHQYSDGVSPCAACPGSSAPQIVYQFWDSLPSGSNLSSFCLPHRGQSLCRYHQRHCCLPVLSSRHRLSYDDCLEDKRENHQNCSVLCCVRQLCTMICIQSYAHTFEQFLNMSVGRWFRFRFSFCAFV